MPFHAPIFDRTSNEVVQCWCCAEVLNLDFGARTGLLVVKAYRNKTIAYQSARPVQTSKYPIGPFRVPAEYGPSVLISEGVPAAYGEPVERAPGTNGPDDPGGTTQTILTPAVDPVYSEPPLIRPAIPSFDEVIAANFLSFTGITAYCDEFALAQPEFEGGEIEEA